MPTLNLLPRNSRRNTRVTEIMLIGPLAGDYALREAPHGRATFDVYLRYFGPDFDAQRYYASEVTKVGISEYLFQIWRRLFEPEAEDPALSPFARAAEKLYGSKLRHGASAFFGSEITALSEQLARDFWLAQMHALIVRARQLAERLAAARLPMLSGLGRRTAETGSSAAIAKRLNPLGAPPQIA